MKAPSPLNLSEFESVTSDDSAALLNPSQVEAVFSTKPLIPLGMKVTLVPFSSLLLPVYSLLLLLKTCHQTMASATWVLITVIRSTVPSIPLCSFKNLVLLHSLSTILLQLYFLVISVPTQMMVLMSWPFSTRAELKGSSVRNFFYSVSATTLVITLNLSLSVTQTLL